MAGDGEGEKEYESDPEEAKMSLKMRRREASDDEDEEVASDGGGGGGGAVVERGKENPVETGSDGESEGQGGAGEYDDEEEVEVEDEDEYYDEEEEEYVEERGDEIGGGKHLETVDEREGKMRRSEAGDSSEVRGEEWGTEGQPEEGKKENEPFAVPTAGAFYMHDDRFRDNVGGRHRRTFVGRKLWEIKDDRKWGHDKFEEMNMREQQYGQGRKSSRGRSRGRGRGRRSDQGHVQGTNRERIFNENNSRTVAPKGVRGRGPRKYQPLVKHQTEAPAPQNSRSGRPVEKTAQANSVRVNVPFSNKDSEPDAFIKVASSLSSASPPFYPSGSSNKEVGMMHKKGVQTGGSSRNMRSFVVEEKSSEQSNSLMRGKNVVDTRGIEKLRIDDASSARPSASIQVPPLLLSTNGGQSSQPRDQSSKALPSTKVHTAYQNSVQGRGQAFLPASAQQLAQRSGSVSQGSSPPRSGVPVNVPEAGNSDSLESSKSKNSLVGKGTVTIQGGVNGSFVFGGTQVMSTTGAMGSGHADPKFPGAPTFLPVMQFGAQHPGGIGVPAVGMAFPGYVGNPQLGFGNSEMTWLPVLTGAAGGMGATYCPPYVAADGSYNARPAGQTPALAAASKDNGADSKPNNERKPQQKAEVANDEFSQRQSKPRRYSEMSFGQ